MNPPPSSYSQSGYAQQYDAQRLMMQQQPGAQANHGQYYYQSATPYQQSAHTGYYYGGQTGSTPTSATGDAAGTGATAGTHDSLLAYGQQQHQFHQQYNPLQYPGSGSTAPGQTGTASGTTTSPQQQQQQHPHMHLHHHLQSQQQQAQGGSQYYQYPPYVQSGIQQHHMYQPQTQSQPQSQTAHHPSAVSHSQPASGALNSSGAASSAPNAQAVVTDPTGQTAPPGVKPKVTTTLWEDEGTLCFQVEAKGICVARREDNDMINGTKLLNVAGMTRGRRDGILKGEKNRHVVKAGAMHLKGVWIPYERAIDFANKEKIIDLLYPLFVTDIKAVLYHPANYARTAQVLSAAAERRKELGSGSGPSGAGVATTSSPTVNAPLSSSVAPNSNGNQSASSGSSYYGAGANAPSNAGSASRPQLPLPSSSSAYTQQPQQQSYYASSGVDVKSEAQRNSGSYNTLPHIDAYYNQGQNQQGQQSQQQSQYASNDVKPNSTAGSSGNGGDDSAAENKPLVNVAVASGPSSVNASPKLYGDDQKSSNGYLSNGQDQHHAM